MRKKQAAQPATDTLMGDLKVSNTSCRGKKDNNPSAGLVTPSGFEDTEKGSRVLYLFFCNRVKNGVSLNFLTTRSGFSPLAASGESLFQTN